MNVAAKQHQWAEYLRIFGRQNAGRRTRLGVFEKNNDVVTDYWLESDLPFEGINIDMHDNRPSVQVTVGNYTHEVNDAVGLDIHFGIAGDEVGIDISSADGRTTVLRFEAGNSEH